MATQMGHQTAREELLYVFRDRDDPVLTAPEVADELGITQQAAHKRLQRAADDGDLKRKTVGARAVVWWVPTAVPDHVTDSDD